MTNIIIGGLIEKNGKFLLVQQAKKRIKGKWSFPVGHLESNENIFQCGIREIKEETGFDVKLTGIVQIDNGNVLNENILSIFFSTEIINENLKYNKKEILDVKWFTYDELLNMKNELRSYDLMIKCVSNFKNNIIADINIVNLV